MGPFLGGDDEFDLPDEQEGGQNSGGIWDAVGSIADVAGNWNSGNGGQGITNSLNNILGGLNKPAVDHQVNWMPMVLGLVAVAFIIRK